MAEHDPIPELKQAAAREIVARLEGYSGPDAGAIIRSDRWRVADLRAGRLERFSLETLLRFAYRSMLAIEIRYTVDSSFARAKRSREALGR